VRCRGCGHAVEVSGGRRIAFGEACEACDTDLHSCVHCAHHDPTVFNACREPCAEPVSDRERANRCEYFRAAADADAGDGEAIRTRARVDLDALFRK
jgi:hypothetical protein